MNSNLVLVFQSRTKVTMERGCRQRLRRKIVNYINKSSGKLIKRVRSKIYRTFLF